jgi:hypothetical protein
MANKSRYIYMIQSMRGRFSFDYKFGDEGRFDLMPGNTGEIKGYIVGEKTSTLILKERVIEARPRIYMMDEEELYGLLKKIEMGTKSDDNHIALDLSFLRVAERELYMKGFPPLRQ